MNKLHITLIGHRQSGEERTAILTCSCGLKYEANLRKETLRSAKARLEALHLEAKLDMPKPKKKSKKTTDSTRVVESFTTTENVAETFSDPITNEFGDDDFANPSTSKDSED